MQTKQAYDTWAGQYDADANKTRDLEARALRMTLSGIPFSNCLEIGCGTGKNTQWLASKAQRVTAVDFSAAMLQKAKEKNIAGTVHFIQADITAPWYFGHSCYDLVSFSLVLEHIEQLDPVFREAAAALAPGGHVYIGELHPFKQYRGSKARFETAGGLQMPECFNHHFSDFTGAGRKHGLHLVEVNEYFDEDNRNQVPRVLVLLFEKL